MWGNRKLPLTATVSLETDRGSNTGGSLADFPELEPTVEGKKSKQSIFFEQ